MNIIRIDLHTHSTASDGTDSPTELIRKAAQAKLAVLALTDHDTLDGLAEAEQEAAKHEIIFVRGCELSTATEWGEAHFLGLWIPQSGAKTASLEKALTKVQEKRRERNLRIAERLRALGIDVTYEDAAALAGGRVVGRPHFAELLCRLGVVEDRKEAFRRYLGRNGEAFVPRELMSPETAVALLKSAGALVSMAHPRLLRAPAEELERLVVRLDSLARARGGRIRADVDTTVFEASIEVILPFFEFGNFNEKELLRQLTDAYSISFEPTDDGCVRLQIIAPYFDIVIPGALPMDEKMIALLEELFGDDF